MGAAYSIVECSGVIQAASFYGAGYQRKLCKNGYGQIIGD